MWFLCQVTDQFLLIPKFGVRFRKGPHMQPEAVLVVKLTLRGQTFHIHYPASFALEYQSALDQGSVKLCVFEVVPMVPSNLYFLKVCFGSKDMSRCILIF